MPANKVLGALILRAMAARNAGNPADAAGRSAFIGGGAFRERGASFAAFERMLGWLSPAEIEDLLRTEVVARLGCHAEGRTYVVPITYAYDGDALILQSADGLKLRMMQQNPLVCVEVDHKEADMQLTPTITFRGIEPSAALEAEIRTRIDKLETYYHPIRGCRALVELAQRHHEAGNHYHVRIDLTVPGEQIVVAHDASLHATDQDIHLAKATKQDEADPERKHALVAVREAFDIARRRLQDYARRQRGTVKTAVRQPRGRVAQLFPIDEYGYIEAEDGHEVYFQKSSVLKNAFDRLMVGSTVSFVEEPGEKGPQASTVKLTHPRRARQPRA